MGATSMIAMTPTSTLVPAGSSFAALSEVQADDARSVASTATVARIRRMGGSLKKFGALAPGERYRDLRAKDTERTVRVALCEESMMTDCGRPGLTVRNVLTSPV